MSATALLVRKEFRALGGLGLAVAAGMLAGLVPLPNRGLRELGPLFYVFGALSLGASVVGHEYRYGTIAQLLAHPIARARILAAKLAVLAAVLAVLAGVAATAVFSQFRWETADREGLIALFTLPLAYGLVVAPWLALKTRSTLAGALFSGALGALLMLGGSWVGWLLHGTDREIDAFRLRVLWSGSAVLCVAAAAGLWRAFATLQAADEVRADINLPGLSSPARAIAPRRRHPVLALAGKELRLQQLAFVATGLYVLVAVTVWARQSTLPRFEDAVTAATMIHGLVVAALMGAFSCAEERGLGTHEWQLLQPVSARAQFAVKVAATAALALLLAVGMPALLSVLFGTPVHGGPRLSVAILAVAALLSGGIYVSSISSSAVAAFFACIPAFMAALWFMQALVGRLEFAIALRLHADPGRHVYHFGRADGFLTTLAGAALVLLVLSCAFANYRAADRSLRRAAIQVAALATAFTAVCVAAAVAGRLLFF